MGGITVLVIGGGGREHALAIGLAESDLVGSIHCCPGNSGTAKVGINHNLSLDDIDGIVKLAKNIKTDLVVVGPEGPLVAGLSDILTELQIPCFGPHSEAALLEGSKLHAKEIMNSLNIPTGGVIILNSESDIKQALSSFKPPWVIKRDVLAGGKGVVVTEEISEAEDFIIQSINTDDFVLLEEFLIGEEASMLVIMDESGYVCLPASQDHKRIGEGDTGLNTGGMGAYAPAPIVTPAVKQRVEDEIVGPMHHYLRNQDKPYRGVLYVGLMINEEGAPSVVEFNVRFGDPETQVTIPLIESDLAELLLATAEGRLSSIDPKFSNKSAVTVVLASKGYPKESLTGLPIKGADSQIEEGEIKAFIHHAGSDFNDQGELISTGGRVLAATAISSDLRSAVEAAYAVIDEIELDGSHYRRDIAFRAL
tara:strand:- start:17845 stop:19113 length:1269 start_codon:yes stop_codon:yes gene_type:complete